LAGLNFFLFLLLMLFLLHVIITKIIDFINNTIYASINLLINISSSLKVSTACSPQTEVLLHKLRHLQVKHSFLITKHDLLEHQIANIDALIKTIHQPSSSNHHNPPSVRIYYIYREDRSKQQVDNAQRMEKALQYATAKLPIPLSAVRCC
jgi:hypothetical protein